MGGKNTYQAFFAPKNGCQQYYYRWSQRKRDGVKGSQPALRLYIAFQVKGLVETSGNAGTSQCKQLPLRSLDANYFAFDSLGSS